MQTRSTWLPWWRYDLMWRHGGTLCGSLLDLTPVDLNFRGSLLNSCVALLQFHDRFLSVQMNRTRTTLVSAWKFICAARIWYAKPACVAAILCPFICSLDDVITLTALYCLLASSLLLYENASIYIKHVYKHVRAAIHWCSEMQMRALHMLGLKSIV